MKFIISQLILFIYVCCFAETYYVEKTGNNNNTGTNTNFPFLTVSFALSKANPGDTIKVGPGKYEEIVSTVKNGIKGNPITIDGQNVATVNAVRVSNSYHNFYNLRVSGYTNSSGYIFSMRRFGHHTTISNCIIDVNYAMKVMGLAWEQSGTDGYPFSTNTSSHNIIINNKITGILGTTAVSMAGDSNLFYGNYVYDIGQADFVRLWGRRNLLKNNTFKNNFYVADIGNHMDFIQTFGVSPFGSWGHVLEGNIVDGVKAGQLSQLEGNGVPEIGNWTFINNIFANIALQASCTIPQIKYYNNVFYKCNISNGGHALNFGSRSYSSGTTSITNRSHGSRVINNVFLECGDERNTVGWYAFGLELTNVYANYNYVGKSGYLPVRINPSKIEIGSTNEWDNFRWWESNGINGGDPFFVDINNLNFRIQPGSFLIDRALTIEEVKDDMYGMVRPQLYGPDIGIHEYFNGIPTSLIPPIFFRVY